MDARRGRRIARNPSERPQHRMMRRTTKTAHPKTRQDWVREPEAAEPARKAPDADEPPLVEDLDADDEDEEPREPNVEAEETPAEGSHGGADDALGLYLRQMG